MNINITNIFIVLRNHHADSIALSTDMPSGIYGEDNLSLDFKVALNKGEEYIKTHFPNIPVEIIKE